MDYVRGEELLARYAAGERDFTGLKLGVCDDTLFSGVDLSGANFTRAELSGSSFIGTNFTGAIFEGAYVDTTELIGANLTGANLRGAIIDSDMEGAILDRADFTGAKGGEVSFLDISAIGTNFTDTELLQCGFYRSNLTEANFSNAILEGTFFTDANLTNANFVGAIGFLEYSRAFFRNTVRGCLKSQARRRSDKRIIAM
jgi:uncharacterized protein YjbI with pentapeptide repeats